ncbi:MAG: metalloregulator ArsR/SmtB family transcription factor [Myxococcaceae bacterium]|nr:metalloregulator ArsR/SmtB family transcription factor [Myxococcaceae bacterium]MCI0673524.1 metalloregulator ArsR/SmtB family transcription factor [Myxococcaceae bacterium]
MVERAEHLDRVFHALADPTRRALLGMVSQRERTVTELAQPFAISLAAVSKHLKVLEAAHLIQRRWEGRVARCRLNAEALRTADEWLGHYRHFWEVRLDSLEQLLKSEAPERRRKK